MNNTYKIRVYDNIGRKVIDSNYESSDFYKHVIKLAVKMKGVAWWTVTLSLDGDGYERNCSNGCKVVVTRLES